MTNGGAAGQPCGPLCWIGRVVWWVILTLAGVAVGAIFAEEIEEWVEPLKLSLFGKEFGFRADFAQQCQLGSLGPIVSGVHGESLGAAELALDARWRWQSVAHTRICSDTNPELIDEDRLAILESINDDFPGCFDAAFPSLLKRVMEDRRFLLAEQSNGAFGLCRTGYFVVADTNRLCRTEAEVASEILLCAPRNRLETAERSFGARPPACPDALLDAAGFPKEPKCS